MLVALGRVLPSCVEVCGEGRDPHLTAPNVHQVGHVIQPWGSCWNSEGGIFACHIQVLLHCHPVHTSHIPMTYLPVAILDSHSTVFHYSTYCFHPTILGYAATSFSIHHGGYRPVQLELFHYFISLCLYQL